MQLPPAAPHPRCFRHFAFRLGTAQRRPLARHLPPLCDSVLHYNIYVDRVAAGAARPDPGLRRVAGQAVRECVRVGLDLQLRDPALGA